MDEGESAWQQQAQNQTPLWQYDLLRAVNEKETKLWKLIREAELLQHGDWRMNILHHVASVRIGYDYYNLPLDNVNLEVMKPASKPFIRVVGLYPI